MKILVTGGTVFVSRYVATYFCKQGHDVYVVNRGTRQQVEGVHLIQADRHHLQGCLKTMTFDTVIDVCGYNRQDIEDLLNALGHFQDYIFISSSAVYPEHLPQPFVESQPIGYNQIWQDYGYHKIEAERILCQRVPQAYILRPPYLYGPMQNIYREPFIFECARLHRPFYLPEKNMQLHFFHVEDLCRMIDIIMHQHPVEHIINVGNHEQVTIEQWIQMCYDIAGVPLSIKKVSQDIRQRNYFPFHDYEYQLDVSIQNQYLSSLKPLYEGLQESYEWYIQHQEDVIKKNYIDYIDEFL